MASWSPADIPDLSGKLALVTGATDGLGLETARMLAAKGARVLLAGRNPRKAERAMTAIRSEVTAADIAFEQVELGELASVRALARRIGVQPLDILVNNAGAMAPSKREVTADGFERALGVNYLSHFVLTGELLDALRAAPAARVVSLSSTAHRIGRIDSDDLQAEKSYRPFAVYGQSKLAMLMFARELQRRSDRHGWGLLSVAAHPGFARTNFLGSHVAPPIVAKVVDAAGRLVSHDAKAGAAPQVLAATQATVAPGSYWGPTGFQEMKGPPGVAKVAPQGRDAAAAARLWEVSQALTGHPFGAGA